MMRDAIYGGVNSAALTPMRDDLSVDIDRLAAHCRWLLGNGCDGIGLLGTTGEANSIGIDERIEAMEGVVARGVPAARLLPGTGVPALTDTVKLTKTAIALGCPGVLVLPPFFYKNPSEDGLFAYFSEVIQRTGGGAKIFLYHFPAQSAVPFTVSLIARLLKAYPGTVKGLKDSSGDMANTLSYVTNFASEGFEVYCGHDQCLLELLRAGGAGCITAASNVGSPVNAQVYANWNNDVGVVAQATLTAVRNAIMTAPLIPGLKALMAKHSGYAGWNNMRPPHLALSAEASKKLQAEFDAVGITLARAA